MQSKFNGCYEYMGFAITNNGSAHEWDVEPLGWDIPALERFKSEAPGFKTLALARKWIKNEGQAILNNK